MVASVFTYSLNRFLASTVTENRTLSHPIAAESYNVYVAGDARSHLGDDGAAYGARVAPAISPTSRFRVRQEPLEMLHQVVIARRAAVFQQILADLLKGQFTGRRHLGRTNLTRHTRGRLQAGR